ncbi:2OG-Fe(II) oxygenase [Planctomicrobium sp. SH668]|uniref:2OG-Fe(II) oxygenase family protein n=1 Tax=Planctomicrobium sp. SH668 TaxID=3448126 RepID=UPI003F5C83EF
MSILDLDRLRDTEVTKTPFEYLIVPDFVRPEARPAILNSYPEILDGGSFPLSSLQYGGEFGAFCEAIRSPEVARIFSEKFGVDLVDLPTTTTVRGRCRKKDGVVHTDSRTKVITVLIYLNDGWANDGGRLRLLNSNNIDDIVTEVPPDEGIMVAFLNRENAWHGHLPFEGVRRVIQLNWVVNEAAARSSAWRHSLSAFFKKTFRRQSTATM